MQIYNARALCGLPVKTGTAAGIHLRVRSSSAMASHDTERTDATRRDVRRFSFRKRMAGKMVTMESVDTCRDIAPGLKCPSHYRKDAVVRFRHAWPRKRDVGTDFAAFVSFLAPLPLISVLSGKKDATRQDGRALQCPYEIYYDGSFIHVVLDLISSSNSLVVMN